MSVKKTDKNVIGKGKAGPGRPKGSRNAVPDDLRRLFLSVAGQLHPDGAEGALLAWAKGARNQAQFWGMIARMLPKTVDATVEVKDSIGEQLDKAAERLRLEELKKDG